MNRRQSSVVAKHVLDRLAAALLLVVTGPVQLGIAVAIRREDGGPALFRQVRPGLHAQPFTVVKFRTMLVDADRYLDRDGRPTRNRVTKAGRFLRTSGLDELPQLINVLKGEMSIVGPRPTLMEYVPMYSGSHASRFAMRPGITGLAQVHGRTQTTLSQRADLDAYYVEHYSLALDLRILGKTALVLLKREGATLDRNPDNIDL